MKVLPLKNIPFVKKGDDLTDLIIESAKKQNIMIENRDVIVIAQSIISKAEGNVIDLKNIEPGDRAREISKKIDQEPEVAEVILQQTREIIRLDQVLISETKHGFICANAGVDASNVESGSVTVLPDNPDESARKIKNQIKNITGIDVVVIISDSWGRPFRLGAVGFAVGVAGIRVLEDLRGKKDAYGRPMESTMIAPPDSLAAAGSLVMGESDEEIPAVLIKNAPYTEGKGDISELLRNPKEDLFR